MIPRRRFIELILRCWKPSFIAEPFNATTERPIDDCAEGIPNARDRDQEPDVIITGDYKTSQTKLGLRRKDCCREERDTEKTGICGKITQVRAFLG